MRRFAALIVVSALSLVAHSDATRAPAKRTRPAFLLQTCAEPVPAVEAPTCELDAPL